MNPFIKFRNGIPSGLLCTLLSALAVAAPAQTLYDGASGKTPDQAPYNWIFGQAFAPSDLHGTAGNGATTLNTAGNNLYMAGYNHFAPFALDSVGGYTVSFDLQVNSETHDGATVDKNGDGIADRAGVSLIVLGNDNKGVELAFWNNEVWTQSNGFLHTVGGGENAAFNTTTGRVHYVLDVANGGYALSADGTALLGGSLHSYVAQGAPYTLPNYLFIGDDTTSARGNFSLFQVQITPEPGALAVLLGLMAGSASFLRRARRHHS